MIQREPTVNPVDHTVDLKCSRKMLQLSQHCSVGQGYTFLKPGRARRVLDKGDGLSRDVQSGQFFVSGSASAILDAKQARLVTE